MELTETWEEDGITYEVYGETTDDICRKMSLEIWERQTQERYAYLAAQQTQKLDYLFLTINPNPLITLNEFISVITKMMSKVWLEEYLYCYEQRGETEGECGKGFHFHAIIKKPTNKIHSHIQREFETSANKLCDSKCIKFFNLKRISEKEKNRKIEYIIGRKADPSKWAKQDMDIPFRERHGLLSYYNIGII